MNKLGKSLSREMHVTSILLLPPIKVSVRRQMTNQVRKPLERQLRGGIVLPVWDHIMGLPNEYIR